MKPELIIRIFTICSLAGLLLAVGMRLTFGQVVESVRRCRFGLILVVNFAAVPLVCALAAKWAGLGQESTIAMVLLGAAPFAPVVPVFALPVGADRYRMIYEHPVEPPRGDGEQAIKEFTQRCTNVLEMYVRRHPDLWLWMHRR